VQAAGVVFMESQGGSVRKELCGQELRRTASIAAKGCHTGKGLEVLKGGLQLVADPCVTS
jgi:hypothetical protein